MGTINEFFENLLGLFRSKKDGTFEKVGDIKSFKPSKQPDLYNDQIRYGLMKLHGLVDDGKIVVKQTDGLNETERIDNPMDKEKDKPTFTDPTTVAKMFPFTPYSNIEENLPHVINGLNAVGFYDNLMRCVALSTIRAETEPFKPISENKHKYNTKDFPFDLYENRDDLGNVFSGDGYRYRGRGYVQLTGRYNYEKIGNKIGINLIANPNIACGPKYAGLILAHFMVSVEHRIRSGWLKRDFKKMRRAVNGGSHGLDRFIDAFKIGWLEVVGEKL